MKLEDVLTEDERLDLWAEMMLVASVIQEYADWWWKLDPGLHRANERRARGLKDQPHPAEAEQE